MLNASRRIQLRFIATFTTFAFLTTSVNAYPVQSPKIEVGAQHAVPLLHIKNVVLPAKLGSVQEIYQSSSESPVAILIQDAHAIPSAQKNIQALIHFFQTKHNVSLVALEGANAPLDPQIFKSFPDKKQLKKIFKEYMEKGELTGGTAAAIFNEECRGTAPASPARFAEASARRAGGCRAPATQYQGIEDWNLYEEGVSLYLQAMEKEPEILEKLESRSKKLEEEKKKIYSKELLELDKTLKDFYENYGYFLEVLQKLAAIAQPAVESELALILEETKKEKGSEEIEKEVKALAERIRKNQKACLPDRQGSDPLNQNEQGGQTPLAFPIKEFNQRYQEFQTSRISPQAFALFLQEALASVCHPEGRRPEGSKIVDSSPPAAGGQGPCSLRMTKALYHSMKNQKRIEEIKGTKLFAEFEQYAESVMYSLMKTEEQRSLNKESKQLRLLERLARLELGRRDWEEVKALSGKRKGLRERGSNGDLLTAYRLTLNAHLALYHNAEQRETAMFRNLKKVLSVKRKEIRKSSSNKDLLNAYRLTPNAAILIAGGFHAQGLTERLKEKGISYLLLMPHIDSIPEQTGSTGSPRDNYRAHMHGEVSWKSYFEVENGKINLYKAFVRATRDRLLGLEPRAKSQEPRENQMPFHGSRFMAHGSMLTLWRDQIILDLAAKNQIEKAGKYTKFLDEISGHSSPVTRHNDLRSEWLSNIERFIDGFRNLQTTNQLTQQNVLNLLKPATVSAVATSGALVVDFSVSAHLIPVAPIPPEARFEKGQPETSKTGTGLGGARAEARVQKVIHRYTHQGQQKRFKEIKEEILAQLNPQWEQQGYQYDKMKKVTSNSRGLDPTEPDLDSVMVQDGEVLTFTFEYSSRPEAREVKLEGGREKGEGKEINAIHSVDFTSGFSLRASNSIPRSEARNDDEESYREWFQGFNAEDPPYLSATSQEIKSGLKPLPLYGGIDLNELEPTRVNGVEVIYVYRAVGDRIPLDQLKETAHLSAAGYKFIQTGDNKFSRESAYKPYRTPAHRVMHSLDFDWVKDDPTLHTTIHPERATENFSGSEKLHVISYRIPVDWIVQQENRPIVFTEENNESELAFYYDLPKEFVWKIESAGDFNDRHGIRAEARKIEKGDVLIDAQNTAWRVVDIKTSSDLPADMKSLDLQTGQLKPFVPDQSEVFYVVERVKSSGEEKSIGVLKAYLVFAQKDIQSWTVIPIQGSLSNFIREATTAIGSQNENRINEMLQMLKQIHDIGLFHIDSAADPKTLDAIREELERVSNDLYVRSLANDVLDGNDTDAREFLRFQGEHMDPITRGILENALNTAEQHRSILNGEVSKARAIAQRKGDSSKRLKELEALYESVEDDRVPRKAAQEMRAGPSKPICRNGLQSTLSGFG